MRGTGGRARAESGVLEPTHPLQRGELKDAAGVFPPQGQLAGRLGLD